MIKFWESQIAGTCTHIHSWSYDLELNAYRVRSCACNGNMIYYLPDSYVNTSEYVGGWRNSIYA